MQQAVLRHFPDVPATYKFTHRDKDVYFTRNCYELFVASVKSQSFLLSETFEKRFDAGLFPSSFFLFASLF